MRKVLLIALACLVWLGSLSACPAKAADELVAKGGRIAPGFYLTIRGKLVALPTPPWLAEIGVAHVIQADGQQVYVSFGADATLLEALSNVGDARVRLVGTLDLVDEPRREKEPDDVVRTNKKILVVRATRLEAVKDSSSKDELRVTAVGYLHPQVVQSTIDNPRRLWEITADKKSLPFSAGTEDLLKNAVALEGNEVQATGTLKNGAFVVEALSNFSLIG